MPVDFLSDEQVGRYQRFRGITSNLLAKAERAAGPSNCGRCPSYGRRRGQLRQRYREGTEDQLGTLGLALNAVVWWNTLYLDAAVKRIRADGFPADAPGAPMSASTP